MLWPLASILTTRSALAYDDWDYGTLIADETGGDNPIGGAIRNWGPSRDVFIAAEEQSTLTGERFVEMNWRQCDNSSCSTHTIVMARAVRGAIFSGTSQVSMGIHRASSTDPIKVGFSLRQKLNDDCDSDTVEWPTDGSEASHDLAFYEWDTVSETFASSDAITYYDGPSNALCTDIGLSRTRRNAGNWHACYTSQPTPNNNGNDRVACNDSASATWNWPNAVTMAAPWTGGEDHPGFDFKDGDLVVAGGNLDTFSNPDEHFVIVHFPDDTAPPSEPRVLFSAGTEPGAVDLYPDLAATSSGVLHLVYEDENGDDITHRRCPDTEDCQDTTDWTATTVHDSDAGQLHHPQLALAGGKQFVLFEKDFSGPQGRRVMMAERCGTDSWGAAEYIRTPDDGETSTETQSIQFGRPSIVANGTDNVVHVLFIEEETDGDRELWWYRRNYTPCGS